MTCYFQFNKDIGGKVICMENLCALNPLDQFFIDLNLVKTLFYDFPIGQQQIEDALDETEDGDSLVYLHKHNMQKLKPLFKKVISQEISKMISKGIHSNISIREMIAN